MANRKFDVKRINPEKIILAVGNTGTGKSTIINMLYNNAFAKNDLEGPSTIAGTADSVTKETEWYFNGKDEKLFGDTIGLGDPNQSNLEIAGSIKKFLRMSKGGVHCIIIVLKFGRLSQEERTNLLLVSKTFAPNWCDSCIIVATHYEGEVNNQGILDEEIQKREIDKWIGQDKEIIDFVNKIGRRVVLTDTSLGRFEENNRPLRKQCLEKLNAFIGTCAVPVGPSQNDFIEILRCILEQYFAFYRMRNAKKRIQEVFSYLSTQTNIFVSSGECSVCLEVINLSELSQSECNHTFHSKCIDLALTSKEDRCPNCRAPITTLFTPVFDLTYLEG